MKPSVSRLAVFLALIILPSAKDPAAGDVTFDSGILHRTVSAGDTCMYYASQGKEYLVDSWGSSQPGDCVAIYGVEAAGCDSSCAERDGCLHVLICSQATDCQLETCGRLITGSGGCIYFESAGLGLYVLSGLSGFSVGDSVSVAGTMNTCITSCIETLRCVDVETIAGCGITPVSGVTWGHLRAIYR